MKTIKEEIRKIRKIIFRQEMIEEENRDENWTHDNTMANGRLDGLIVARNILENDKI